jgi:hypothetical protein
MSKKIHFEDDLYFLTASIKTLQNGLSLEIDPDYFIDRTVEDIFFIDTTLDLLYASLKENEHLLGRSEYLRRMLSIKRGYAEFLGKLLTKELPFGVHLEPFFEKLKGMKDRQLKDINEIFGIIEITGVGEAGDADIVSSDELTELFRPSGDEIEKM